MPKTPGTAGRPHGPSDPIASRPVHLVDPTGLRTRARLSRESWSNLRTLEPDRESLGRAGQHHGPSDLGCGHPGQLVDPAGPHAWAQARVDRDSWMTLLALRHGPEWPGATGQLRGHSATGPCRPGQRVDPRALGPKPESPRRAGRHCRPTDTGPSRLGQLVDPAGHQTHPEAPGTAG